MKKQPNNFTNPKTPAKVTKKKAPAKVVEIREKGKQDRKTLTHKHTEERITNEEKSLNDTTNNIIKAGLLGIIGGIGYILKRFFK